MVNFIDLLARGYVHRYGPRQSSTVGRAAAQGWEGSAFILLYRARGGIQGVFVAKWHITSAQTFGLETQTLATLQVGPKDYHLTSSEGPSFFLMAETNRS